MNVTIISAEKWKTCRDCDEVKSVAEFYRVRNGNRDGFGPYCKSCHKQRSTMYARRNPQRRAQIHLRATVKHRWGITVEEYRAIIARGCAICGTHDGKLCIDHDHATGRIRDALCNSCNIGIGMFRDNPERLQAAIDYLLTHHEDADS